MRGFAGWIPVLWLLAGRVMAAGLSLSAIWDGEGGLPNPVVNVVRQSRVGDLWCGTYFGLARFDGVRFAVLESDDDDGLAGRGVTAFHEDRNGVLWAGMGSGALCRVEGRDRLKRQPLATHGEGAMAGIAEDAAGDLWVLWTDGSLMRVRDSRMFPAPAGIKPWEPELELVSDGEHRLWLMSRTGFYEVTADGLVAAAAGISAESGWVQRAALSRRGGMWVVVGAALRRWDQGAWVEEHPCGWWDAEDDGLNRYVTAMRELGDGRLLIGLIEGGAAVGMPGGEFQKFGTAEGLSHEWVRCVAEDREGNLWLGTGGGGLAALRPRRVEMVEVERSGARHNLQSIAMGADGGVWVGTEGGGAWHLADVSPAGIAAGFTRVECDASPYVWTVVEDGTGRVWLGTWDGDLHVREKGAERFVAAPGWKPDLGPVRLMLAASDGRLWVGGGRELQVWRDGIWQREDAAGRPLAPKRQVSIAEDRDGAIWVGLEDGTVARRTGDEMVVYGREVGLPGDAVMTILPRDDGSVWMGTMGGGLVRFRDGRAVALSGRHGFPSRVVSQLLEDGTGNLWAGTREGICRVGFDALDACADGRESQLPLLLLSKTDGMATQGCSAGGLPGAGRSKDGRLWFATNRGIAVVDPKSIRVNLLPPPVVIESIAADGVEHRADGGSRVFGPGAVSCTISYTALSFVAPERVRFRTRLKGLESEWQEAGGARATVYRNLQPGDYTFEVIASNNDGVWNHVGTGIAFVVRPHWWQTVWFKGLAAGAAACGLGAAFRATERRRNAAALARLERSHALERERARIARDIHDDLGSGLTRIMLLSRQVLEEIPVASPAAEEIGQIGKAAEKLTQAMDEIVWAVDPRHDSLDSLVGYVGSAAQEILSAAGIRFRLEAPNNPPAWPLSADRRHGLFLAFKEALHNVVRHSGARLVKVAFVVADGGFTLSVEDDGRGIEPETPSRRAGGGRGLEHLKRRMSEIGGTLEIASEPGSGTRVAFRMPVEPERPPGGRSEPPPLRRENP